MTQEELRNKISEKEKRASEILSVLDTDFDMSRSDEMNLRSELANLCGEIHTFRAEELLPKALESVMPYYEKISGDDDDKRYETEVYASYADVMDEKTIQKIVESDYPEDSFQDNMETWYQDEMDHVLNQIIEKVEEELSNNGVDIDYVKNGLVNDYVASHVDVRLPYDHFLNQEVDATIILDTGDWNHEFSINCHYPCNSVYAIKKPPQEGEEGYEPYDQETFIDPKSGLVWLAKSQGYTGKDLHLALMNDYIIPDEKIKALCSFDEPDPKLTFLESIYWEMVNCPSSGPCVTFLVKMKFKDFLKLNDILRERDRNGYVFSPEKRHDCGTIKLSKDTVTGLYDNTTGGGSLAAFSISLEKDIELPIKYIGVAAPSVGNSQGIRYAVKETYGFCSSVWKETLQDMIPEKEVIA